MSGGSYDYVYLQFDNFAAELRNRHPTDAVMLAFADYVREIAKVAKDIEWVDSGDTSWTPELTSEIEALVRPEVQMDKARELLEAATEEVRRALERARAVR